VFALCHRVVNCPLRNLWENPRLRLVALRLLLLLPVGCRFNFSMLNHNHERNFSAFRDSLNKGIHTIIVDNTNILRRYFENYEGAAEEQGYEVKIEVVGEFTRSAAALYASRNVHGVPYEKVMQMLEQWQEEEEEDEEDSYDSISDDSDEEDGRFYAGRYYGRYYL
jgi:hypothetical protein